MRAVATFHIHVTCNPKEYIAIQHQKIVTLRRWHLDMFMQKRMWHNKSPLRIIVCVCVYKVKGMSPCQISVSLERNPPNSGNLKYINKTNWQSGKVCHFYLSTKKNICFKTVFDITDGKLRATLDNSVFCFTFAKYLPDFPNAAFHFAFWLFKIIY